MSEARIIRSSHTSNDLILWFICIFWESLKVPISFFDVYSLGGFVCFLYAISVSAVCSSLWFSSLDMPTGV